MTLALFGGQKAVPEGTFKAWPHIERTEINHLTQKFQSLSFWNYRIDEDIIRFEEAFRDYIGVGHCFTLNSGTAALYSALVALDLRKSDEVIIPAYCFFSAATAIRNAGGTVRFCDIDPDTYNLSIESFEKMITKQTRAVIPVHVFGTPCEMDEINKRAKQHDLTVIEDACQSHGATYKGQKTGSLGDIGAFSFHISKNLPIMEGGAITTNNVSLRDAAASANLFPNYVKEHHQNLGHNFKFNGLFAKIGLERLKHLDKYNERRAENYRYLKEGLSQFDFIRFQRIAKHSTSAHSMFVIQIDEKRLGVSDSCVDSRNRFLLALHKEGVHCGVWNNMTVPAMDMFRMDDNAYPNARVAAESTLYISGIHYPNSTQELDCVITAVKKISDERDKLKNIR